MELLGKAILVAGGAGRIGHAISRSIVERGANVLMADIVDSPSVRDLIAQYPDSAAFLQCDTTDCGAVNEAISTIVRRFGAISGAVQSAYPRSAGWGTSFEHLSPEFLFEDLQKQLGGTILFAQRVVAALRERTGGSIVLISSIQGLGAPKFRHYAGTSMSSPIEYSAIKAGVNAVARYLAKYLVRDQIRVNTVSPGGIRDAQPTSFVERYREDCSNKGMLDADDIVGAVCFLLSDDARYINGQNLIVDDGWSL